MFDEIDLDEICDLLERAQELNHKASTNQDTLFSGFPDAEGPIAVCQISDWRIASYGTDHQYARRFLQEIESVPDLYLVIVGDMQNMQVNLSQGVAACSDNILTPAMQHKVLEAWLSRVAARTLASTWDNHAVEREEKGTGASLAAHVFSERVPYFNGIGHWDLVVGPETYKIAISHKFRGRSDNNPCMGGMKYLRFHANNREIAMCGDSHVPGLLRWNEGGTHRIAINSGTLQASGYSKRYFSLTADKVFPVIQFFPDRHLAIPYWSVEEWLAASGRL
jgi:hypothetical protein